MTLKYFFGQSHILKLKFAIFTIYLLIIFCSTFQAYSRPRKANKYINQADWEILSQKYDKAIANYFKGIIFAPWKEKVEVWDDLGYAYLQKKETKKAKKYLIQSLSVHPENFNPRFYLAVAYISNKEIELASEQLKIIEENIHFDPSWIIRKPGIIMRKPNGKLITKEELERVKKEKGIYLEEKSANEIIIHLDAFDERNEGAYYFTQSVISKINEEFEQAENKLFEALKADYNEREVRLQLADLYLRQGRQNKVEEQLKKTLDQASSLPAPHQIKFEICHRLKHHNNNIISVLHGIFLEELEKGEINEAIKILEQSLDVNEQSFLINHNLALLCYDTGKTEKAEIYCGRALWFKDYLKVSKDHIIGCHDLMGNIYYHQKRYDKALEEFKNILKIDEQNVSGHYNLGSVYYTLSDWQKAEQEWKKAIEYERKAYKSKKGKSFSGKELEIFLTVRTKSFSFLSHVSLAQLYFDQNFIERAAEECERAIKLRPKDPNPYFIMAKIYLTKKELKKVNFYLERFLYLGGRKNEEVNKLINLLKNKKKKKSS